MSLPAIEAAGDVPIVSVFIDDLSSGSLAEGDAVAYVEDATLDASPARESRGRLVEKPTSDSINFIAGIVTGTDAGKSEGSFLSVVRPRPGDVVKVLVNGATNVVVGDLLEYDTTKAAFIKATAAAGDYLFRALEGTTSDDKKLLLAYKV